MEDSQPSGSEPVFAGAWSDGMRVWRQLLATDLVFKLLAFAVLTPLVGLALEAGVAASGSSVLADIDILLFFLRPLGLLLLVGVAAFSIAIVALELACLMAIGVGATAGVRVDSGQAVRFALGRALPVFELAVRVVARSLLLAAPFLLGLGLVYLGLLRDFDINYYLKEKPPAFLAAVGLVLALVIGLAAVLVPRLVSWSLALPLVLFEDVPPRRALAESARRTDGERRRISRTLILWGVAALLLASVLPAAIFGLGRLVAPFGMGNVGWVLGFMLLLTALWVVINLLISWGNTSAFALLVVQIYRRLGGRDSAMRARLAEAEPLTAGGAPRLSFALAMGAVVLLALIAGGIGVYLLRGVRGQGEVVVIAHRGAAASAPENTLASVQRAIDEGADFVEIDVQETADGEIAVLHDSDLMRVAGVDLKIWDATVERLAGIDIGSWFAPEFHGERVPLLRDVLSRARGSAKVMIELKYYGHDIALAQRAVDIVEGLAQAGNVVAMSLEYDQVRRMRELRPQWTLGLLTAKAVGDLTTVDADFLAVNAGIATRAFVRRAHARGKKVYVWTINDPVQMFRMLNLGVDGLITDEPAIARWVIERRSGMSSAERLLVGLAFFFGAAAPDPPAAVDAPV
ncbi:MAG: glycerophosphoryl diester phosphodiesterase membrane domain-containing protein [Thermoanaerobaculia bacterium]|jgi:glycerophosphoryl diester phosphodiesterase|nr:glycerophosphoryl diester phosphodiesterase membrane domain-containing protein [Thermoanaerobaculia bacterium]MBP9824269.1 glycerophosphoryl diester phosphodiesterase membrane domain-containing protein [Thermoanaerobaculia bacterium]